MAKDLPLERAFPPNRYDLRDVWTRTPTFRYGRRSLCDPREDSSLSPGASEEGGCAITVHNGIRASLRCLKELAEAGLVDVAFHVE